jgi:hypothetical protein
MLPVIRREIALAALIALCGCGGRTSLGGPPEHVIRRDGAPPLTEAGRPRDWGPSLERDPRDLPHWPPADFFKVPDKALPCSKSIGSFCQTSSGCCGGLQCVQLATGVGVCTKPCTPDDYYTPLINEDSCPDFSKNICSNTDYPGPTYHCLQRCEPIAGQATCPAGLACEPESDLLSQEIGTAVCAYPTCNGPTDCPVYLSEICNLATPVPPCGGSPVGAFCAPDSPGGVTGTCALPGQCDQVSGLCLPHSHGDATATVGSPCKDDRDCAGNMTCEQQMGSPSSGAIHARHGYCVVQGCGYSDTLTVRACPPGSTCQHFYPGGRCYKVCDLNKASDCRGHPADKHGDYECYAWNNLWYSSMAVADQPTCEPADNYPCSFWGSSNLDCSVIGLQPDNSTEMGCRNRSSGALLSTYDPGGYCLDLTASGN